MWVCTCAHNYAHVHAQIGQVNNDAAIIVLLIAITLCVRTATVVVAMCSATFQFLQSARVATTAVKVIFTLTKYTQNMVAIWHMCSNVLASFPG